MPNLSPVPDRVALTDVTEIAAAVPHLLGFHPVQSLVVVALRGPRRRLSFSMRFDLLDPAQDGEVADTTAMRMAGADADAALLFVYTSAPARPRRGGGPDLPRRPLVERIASALDDIPLVDALLVDDGRVWSYLCDEPRCCPPQGRRVEPMSAGALALAAAHALQGGVVLPDREALVATTRAVGGITAISMRAAIARGLDRPGWDDPDDVCAEVVDPLCRRFDDPPARLDHDEAAGLVLALHDVVLRDRLIGRLARGDVTLERLLTEVARLAQPPYDAPVACLLSVIGYLRGDGVVAVAAAERALASDPDYSMAELLLDSVDHQVEPAALRALWSQDLP